MSQTKEPSYKILHSLPPFEIREYENVCIAEVTTHGPREVAITEGFKILADYIFGNNAKNEVIPMTKPVIQQKMGFEEWKIAPRSKASASWSQKQPHRI